MDKYEESQRGYQASQLIDNPIYKECISELRKGIVEKWRTAPIRDSEGLYSLKLMDKLLTDIEGYIKNVAETGKMADIQLEREKNVANLRKVGIR